MEEIQKLQASDVVERAAAAESLALMGRDAAPAATALVNACRDDEEVSQWAVAALEQLGPPPEGQLAELARLASSSDPLAAYWSITLLGRAGESALPLQDVLAEIVAKSPEPSVRERAVWAIAKIGGHSHSVTEALASASKAQQQPRLARIASDTLAQIND